MASPAPSKSFEVTSASHGTDANDDQHHHNLHDDALLVQIERIAAFYVDEDDKEERLSASSAADYRSYSGSHHNSFTSHHSRTTPSHSYQQQPMPQILGGAVSSTPPQFHQQQPGGTYAPYLQQQHQQQGSRGGNGQGVMIHGTAGGLSPPPTYLPQGSPNVSTSYQSAGAPATAGSSTTAPLSPLYTSPANNNAHMKFTHNRSGFPSATSPSPLPQQAQVAGTGTTGQPPNPTLLYQAPQLMTGQGLAMPVFQLLGGNEGASFQSQQQQQQLSHNHANYQSQPHRALAGSIGDDVDATAGSTGSVLPTPLNNSSLLRRSGSLTNSTSFTNDTLGLGFGGSGGGGGGNSVSVAGSTANSADLGGFADLDVFGQYHAKPSNSTSQGPTGANANMQNGIRRSGGRGGGGGVPNFEQTDRFVAEFYSYQDQQEDALLYYNQQRDLQQMMYHQQQQQLQKQQQHPWKQSRGHYYQDTQPMNNAEGGLYQAYHGSYNNHNRHQGEGYQNFRNGGGSSQHNPYPPPQQAYTNNYHSDANDNRMGLQSPVVYQHNPQHLPQYQQRDSGLNSPAPPAGLSWPHLASQQQQQQQQQQQHYHQNQQSAWQQPDNPLGVTAASSSASASTNTQHSRQPSAATMELPLGIGMPIGMGGAYFPYASDMVTLLPSDMSVDPSLKKKPTATSSPPPQLQPVTVGHGSHPIPTTSSNKVSSHVSSNNDDIGTTGGVTNTAGPTANSVPAGATVNTSLTNIFVPTPLQAMRGNIGPIIVAEAPQTVEGGGKGKNKGGPTRFLPPPPPSLQAARVMSVCHPTKGVGAEYYEAGKEAAVASLVASQAKLHSPDGKTCIAEGDFAFLTKAPNTSDWGRGGYGATYSATTAEGAPASTFQRLDPSGDGFQNYLQVLMQWYARVARLFGHNDPQNATVFDQLFLEEQNKMAAEPRPGPGRTLVGPPSLESHDPAATKPKKERPPYNPKRSHLTPKFRLPQTFFSASLVPPCPRPETYFEISSANSDGEDSTHHQIDNIEQFLVWHDLSHEWWERYIQPRTVGFRLHAQLTKDSDDEEDEAAAKVIAEALKKSGKKEGEGATGSKKKKGGGKGNLPTSETVVGVSASHADASPSKQRNGNVLGQQPSMKTTTTNQSRAEQPRGRGGRGGQQGLFFGRATSE